VAITEIWPELWVPMTDSPPDDEIRAILAAASVIALVGASPNPARPANAVMRYLLSAGYRVIPVNPGHAGGEILGQRAFARLRDIGEPIDIVDIFRRREALAGIVAEALTLDPMPKVIWMQVGLRDEAAAARATAAGVQVVTDRCTRIEHHRLIADRQE
jgi:predicted CoA-binding protein